jgi:hypothetical protein
VPVTIGYPWSLSVRVRYIAMKRLIPILILVLASGSAFAHGRSGARVHLGFHFGVPLGSAWYHPWYYYPPPTYYPYYRAPIVVQPASPPVYVERSDVVPEGTASWYYCRDANGYYPYVRQCPGGWERVPARPAQ